jgi:hypothetical protein
MLGCESVLERVQERLGIPATLHIAGCPERFLFELALLQPSNDPGVKKWMPNEFRGQDSLQVNSNLFCD